MHKLSTWSLKNLGRVSFGSKKFGPKIFLLIFSLNWIILRKLFFVFCLIFFSNLRKFHPNPKLKNNWGPLSSTFHVERPETLIEWKFKSMTNGRTDRQTWVGARDACASKNKETYIVYNIFTCQSVPIHVPTRPCWVLDQEISSAKFS